MIESVGWHAKWRVDKWYPGSPLDGPPDETIEAMENLLLNEGITRLLNLLIGTTTNPFNNANARLGVGNGTTAAAATQTDLQGASKSYKAMDATYPQVSGQTVTFKSTFGTADANHAWEEFVVDNGATALETLNRKVQALGTKVSGSTWVLTVTITLS